MSSSREYLDMDSSKSASSIKFKASSGFFVNRWLAAILFLLFLGSLVAVGLLVYYLAPSRGGRAGLAPSADDASGLHGGGDTGGDGTAKKLTDVLLPTNLAPIHYELTLKPFLPPGNFSFAGFVQVHIKCVRPTSEIYIHSFNISVHENTVRVVGPKGVQDIDKMRYDVERQFFIISLKKKLESGSTYNVSMHFLGLLNDDMVGFYRSSYKDENGQEKWMAVTQFQPTDARRAFPCFDEPGYKATFDVTLMRPMTSHMTSLSNMPILRTEDRDSDWRADVYERTLNMSTYLLAFVISEFESQSRNARNTKFRVWARPEAMDQADYALHAGPKTLDFFEEYFNVSFPLPKQDMIAVPDFRAGAMENWGLITYREQTLLFDKKMGSWSNKRRVLVVIVHELAHQWFGNLVTPKWWDDLWLNEGFASYMEYVGADHVEPTWNMLDQFISSDLHDVLEEDSLETSHPISLPVTNPDEINEIFDSISYNKGASVIRMMLHYLGESTFRKGLTNYLTEFSFKNAAQDDLWNHLTMASKEDGKNVNVKEVMDTWTLQVGYPVIKVERDYAKKTATVTQTRFFMVPKNRTESDAPKEKWHVPITYTTSSERNFTRTSPHFWLYKNNDSIVISNDKGGNVPNDREWMIFNIGETNFYRVNYDLANWNLLANQLLTNHKLIPYVNRAQILDDSLDLARGNEVDYNLALNITKYLIGDTDYLPWRAASSNFAFIGQMLRVTSSYGNWKRYVLKLVTPLHDKLGFDEQTSDTPFDKLTRTVALSMACRAGHKQCKQKATSLYKDWMQNPNSSVIPPDIKQAVICFAIELGGEEEWNFAFDRYLKSNVGSEKDMLLRSMGCSEQSWILSKYLELSVDPKSGIRKSDSSTVFSSVAGTSTLGRFLAFDFLRNEWAVIKEMHGTGFFAISAMIKSVTMSFNTQFELQQLKQFIAEHKSDLGTATRTLSQCSEATEANIMWMKYNYPTIESWLKQNVV